LTTCIEHTGCKTKGGYGLRFWKGKTRLAHRVAYAVHHGRSPEDVGTLLHSCDNRACINVDHLREGTDVENCTDRLMRGPRHAKTKLTVEQAVEIRNSQEHRNSLAAKFNVSERTIRAIKSGESWGQF
jgi:hypothetical protein